MELTWSWQTDGFGYQSELCVRVCVYLRLLVFVRASCFLDAVPNLRSAFAAIWHYFYFLFTFQVFC